MLQIIKEIGKKVLGISGRRLVHDIRMRNQLKIIDYYMENVKNENPDEKNFVLLQEKVIAYTHMMKCNDFSYRFSEHCALPTLYASVYACMILGFWDKIRDDE